jgi:hypothetical protein
MMPDEQKSAPAGGQPTNYQIRVKGHLGQQWLAWFEGLSITREAGGNTLLIFIHKNGVLTNL